MQTTLSVRASWSALGDWRILNRAIRGRGDSAAVRTRCKHLVRLLVKHNLYNRRVLREVVPNIVRTCPTGATLSALDLAVCIAQAGVDGATFVHQCLTNPGRYELDFENTVKVLLRLNQRAQVSGVSLTWTWRGLMNVTDLPLRQRAVLLEGLTYLAGLGRDPQALVRWTSSVASHLRPQEFEPAFELALQLIGKGMQAPSVIEVASTSYHRAGSPETQQPAMLSTETLLRSIEMQGRLAFHSQQLSDGRTAHAPGNIVSNVRRLSMSLKPEHLAIALNIADLMLDQGANPCPLLEWLPGLASLNDRQFAASVDIAGQLGRHRLPLTPALAKGLTSAATQLTWSHYLAVVDAALRLAEQKIEPTVLCGPGSEVLATALDFEGALSVIEQYVMRVSKWPSEWLPHGDRGLVASRGTTSVSALTKRLEAYEQLVQRITAARGEPGANPGPDELLKQALTICEEYEDYTVTYHPAETHEETDYDSYYGSSSSHTVVDQPARIVLTPSGPLRRSISIALRTIQNIQSLVSQRSWLWRSIASAEGRDQYQARIEGVRSVLEQFVDGIVRGGLIQSANSVAAIYLIGSYPWVPRPHDLDLFVLVEGDRDVTRTAGRDIGFESKSLGTQLDIEVVGWNTLLNAVEGVHVRHREDLAQRYALLYGSVLLAGRDVHEGITMKREALASFRDGLIENCRRENWPELEGNAAEIAAKREWRLREVAALDAFLGEV